MTYFEDWLLYGTSSEEDNGPESLESASGSSGTGESGSRSWETFSEWRGSGSGSGSGEDCWWMDDYVEGLEWTVFIAFCLILFLTLVIVVLVIALSIVCCKWRNLDFRMRTREPVQPVTVTHPNFYAVSQDPLPSKPDTVLLQADELAQAASPPPQYE